VGDVALFLPTSYQGESRVYLAFHHNCPHRYLSHESLESIRAGGNRYGHRESCRRGAEEQSGVSEPASVGGLAC
jgi:hypothetical protein